MRSFLSTTAIASTFFLSPAFVVAGAPTDAPDRGVWLGVYLCAVPDALAGHLQLEGSGLMVRNVFTDSPADKAGLDRYDVIVKADGQDIGSNAQAFNRDISDKKPGDTLDIDYYHKGKLTHAKITLTARTRDWDELDRKYPDERSWYQWDHPQDHFSAPEEWMEGPWAQRFRNRKDDAYDLWKQYYDQYDEKMKDWSRQQERYNKALKNWKERYDQYLDQLKDWRHQKERYNKSLKDWQERMKESLPTDKWEQWKEWYDDFSKGPMQEIQPPIQAPDEEDAISTTRPWARSGIHFEQQPDGKIIVHLQKNDASLSRTFESVDDLKKNAPKLYEQYQALQEQMR